MGEGHHQQKRNAQQAHTAKSVMMVGLMALPVPRMEEEKISMQEKSRIGRRQIGHQGPLFAALEIVGKQSDKGVVEQIQ